MGNLRRGSSLCRQVSWSPEREAVVVRRPRPHLAVVARSPYVRGSSSSKRHIQRDDAPRHEGKQSSQTGFTDMVIMSSVHLIQKRLVCLPIWIPLNGEATCFSRLLWRDWRLSLFDLISQNLLLRLLFNFPFKKNKEIVSRQNSLRSSLCAGKNLNARGFWTSILATSAVGPVPLPKISSWAILAASQCGISVDSSAIWSSSVELCKHSHHKGDRPNYALRLVGVELLWNQSRANSSGVRRLGHVPTAWTAQTDRIRRVSLPHVRWGSLRITLTSSGE